MVLLAGLFAAARGDLAWLAGAAVAGAATVVGLVGYAFSPRARAVWAVFLKQFGSVTEVRLDERSGALRFVGPGSEEVVPIRDLHEVRYDKGDGETPPTVRFIHAGGTIRTGEPLLFSLLIEHLRTLSPGFTVKGWDDA
jgi:hypothetical protein